VEAKIETNQEIMEVKIDTAINAIQESLEAMINSV
jgi:hypothetical protein